MARPRLELGAFRLEALCLVPCGQLRPTASCLLGPSPELNRSGRAVGHPPPPSVEICASTDSGSQSSERLQSSRRTARTQAGVEVRLHASDITRRAVRMRSPTVFCSHEYVLVLPVGVKLGHRHPRSEAFRN
jgi:hypothetical protein